MNRRAMTWAALCLAWTGCVQEHAIDVQLSWQAAPSGSPAAYELWVTRGPACPAVSALLAAGGAGVDVVHHQAFAPEAGTAVGALAPGPYAFSAVARDPGCLVLGSGCRSVRIGTDDAVQLEMMWISGSDTLACGPGERCTRGICGAGTMPDAGPPPPDAGSCTTVPCSADGTGACCAGFCVDVAADRRHCGGCDRPCTAESVCNSRCGPAPRTLTIRVDGSGGTALRLVVAWQNGVRSMEAWSADVEAAAADGLTSIPLEMVLPPTSDFLSCATGIPCSGSDGDLAMAFATVILYDGATPIAKAPVAVLYATRGAIDGAELAALWRDSGIERSLPGGVVPGIAAYVETSPSGTAPSLRFAREGETFLALRCEMTGCSGMPPSPPF